MSKQTACIVLVEDIFVVVRILNALKALDWQPLTPSSMEDLRVFLDKGEGDLAVLELASRKWDWRQALKAVRQASARNVPVMAFGAHMDVALLKEAREAGCDKVVANSTLARDLPAILRKAAEASPAPAPAASAPGLSLDLS